MASLFKTGQLSAYRDRRFKGTQAEFDQALRASTTVYVGNLSFYTTEEQIQELFSRTGEIRRIIMGLDKNTMTPCGFCFVIYYTREDAENAVKYISGTMLDDRPIRVDFDWGFEDGRQWGRGRSGGQVRDEYRTDYDPGRGGYGKLVQRELEEMQRLGALALMEGAAASLDMGPAVMGAILPPVLPPGMPAYAGHAPHMRQPHRRDRRSFRSGPPTFRASSGNRHGADNRGGGRKRGREEGGAQEGEQMQTDGPQEQPRGPGDPSERQNPRFRERGEDSDEERA